MTVRLAINGFGRTGRSFLRAALTPTHDFEVVAINDLGAPAALARLFARDSVHGRYPEPVYVEGDNDDRRRAPHQDAGGVARRRRFHGRSSAIDVVVESTGKYTKREQAAEHLEAGATRVVISAPADDPDATFVDRGERGSVRPAAALHHLQCVVHDQLPGSPGKGARRRLRHRRRLHDNRARLHRRSEPRRRAAQGRPAGPRRGDQHRPDNDRRRKGHRARPPERAAGRLDGLALRVPVPDASITDLVANLRSTPSVAEVNDAYRTAAESRTARTVSSSTPTSRSCRATSSTRPLRASSIRG